MAVWCHFQDSSFFRIDRNFMRLTLSWTSCLGAGFTHSPAMLLDVLRSSTPLHLLDFPAALLTAISTLERHRSFQVFFFFFSFFFPFTDALAVGDDKPGLDLDFFSPNLLLNTYVHVQVESWAVSHYSFLHFHIVYRVETTIISSSFVCMRYETNGQTTAHGRGPRVVYSVVELDST